MNAAALPPDDLLTRLARRVVAPALGGVRPPTPAPPPTDPPAADERAEEHSGRTTPLPSGDRRRSPPVAGRPTGPERAVTVSPPAAPDPRGPDPGEARRSDPPTGDGPVPRAERAERIERIERVERVEGGDRPVERIVTVPAIEARPGAPAPVIAPAAVPVPTPPPAGGSQAAAQPSPSTTIDIRIGRVEVVTERPAADRRPAAGSGAARRPDEGPGPLLSLEEYLATRGDRR